jgi:hypothetical protein
MAGNSTDIQAGLRNALTAVPGLRVADHFPESINPPMAMIMLQQVTFHRAFGGGLSQWEFVISCVAGRMGDRAAQLQLDAWLAFNDYQSIRKAIEADLTLGGASKTLVTSDAVGIKPLTVGDAVYLNVEFTVTVHA